MVNGYRRRSSGAMGEARWCRQPGGGGLPLDQEAFAFPALGFQRGQPFRGEAASRPGFLIWADVFWRGLASLEGVRLFPPGRGPGGGTPARPGRAAAGKFGEKLQAGLQFLLFGRGPVGDGSVNSVAECNQLIE